MNLIIDIGNSLYKIGFFDNHVLCQYREAQTQEQCIDFIVEHQNSQKNLQNCLISSTRKKPEILVKAILELNYISSDAIHILSHDTPLPIENHYNTPKTLGMDRLAAAVGATTIFAQKNCLIIDLGTCITYDFINKKSQFLGGTIAPGVQMRLDAMHHFTEKLPEINWDKNNESIFPNLLAKSTQEAMLSGAINGVKMEILGIIEHYKHIYENLEVILCGGDAIYFENTLKGSIFALPKLVLFGLNRILDSNVLRSS
jgi:type III pantothenate kinase